MQLVVLLWTVVATVIPSVQASPRALHLRCSGSEQVTQSGDLRVSAVLTNTGDETLKILNQPDSILSPSWTTQKFHVTNSEGTLAKFRDVRVSQHFLFIFVCGIIIDYAIKVRLAAKITTEATSYTILNPGDSIESTHVLDRLYNLTVTGASELYSITPFESARTFTYVSDDGTIAALVADVGEPYWIKVKRSSPSTIRTSFDKAVRSEAIVFNGYELFCC